MSKTKRKLLRRLGASVALFYPELADHFLCPTCLSVIPLGDASSVSEAHIVPSSAGGGSLTVICKSCNSQFGAMQDKWMGEYLRLRKLGRGSILQTHHQQGHFSIGGVRVSGTYHDTLERGVELLIWSDKCSPESLRQLDSIVAGRPSALEISIPMPLLQHRALVEIGFLTAAYLLWFRSWTYCWALQEHLDPVRRQIQAPEAAILDPKKFAGHLGEILFETPTIGVGLVDERTCLFAGIGDRIVLLPPASAPDLYESLPDSIGTRRFHLVKELTAVRPNEALGPIGLLFEDGLLLAPDVVRRDPASAKFYLITKDGKGPLELFPLSEAKFAELRKGPNSVLLMSSISAPKKDTGRPPRPTQGL